MTNSANVEIEPGDARGLRAAKARMSNAPFIALALLFLPLNAGTLLYTAKNAADVRESHETLAAVKRSIDSLRLQIDKQDRNIGRADDAAPIRQQVERLVKDLSALSEQMRSGFLAAGGSVILSAPGKGVTQRLDPSQQARSGATADDGQPAIDAESPSVADLPRYERSVSPEGKLILRKVQ
ncbi:hypothetical protein [Sinorhizobium mexicanum]|uniref:Uncharacterized protein n=1 Tax=Sinorhizobium mexicanum TaxID=375549 RepID=A0A859QGQ9_9HYPH|nr:hypothetical protein [Sinorhizobium mexicanum]MBP1886666.1 putative phage tail protein [Sinorhizobium mexicanum]QLL65883.1 hypothetical protein FKV68_31955 [Sinorhizobium mexicanum]